MRTELAPKNFVIFGGREGGGGETVFQNLGSKGKKNITCILLYFRSRISSASFAMLDKGSNLRDFIHECCWNPNGDRIQGLKLRCFGKFNFTYHGKLQHRSGSSTAAIYIAAMAAIDKGEKESLFYCGSFTAAAIYKGARVDEGGGCQTRRPRLLRHPLLLRLVCFGAAVD